MKSKKAPRETKVASTEGHGSESFWDKFLVRLQTFDWIDETLVRREWETCVQEGSSRDTSRLKLLTKLRLALIQAQIRSAPDSFEIPEAVYVRNEHARDMLRFLDRGEFPIPDEVVELTKPELPRIEQLAKDLAKRSLELPTKDTARVWLSVAGSRLAKPHARVFRTQEASRQQSRLLQASEQPCSGSPLRTEILENDWPLIHALQSRRVKPPL